MSNDRNLVEPTSEQSDLREVAKQIMWCGFVESAEKILGEWTERVREEIQNEAVKWVQGYAGPTNHDAFIEKLLQALQVREESAKEIGREEMKEQCAVTNLSQQDYENLVRDAMLWRKAALRSQGQEGR
jgi:hypothetical protein